MQIQPVDRALCLTAALLGLGAFLLALRAVSDPHGSHPGWVLPVGIVALLIGLSAASLVTWRGRWR
ncbi:MAG TPA: hypothetical protein VE258_13225 [Ktedonobacterales bacterium]|nr:hypothetical protein [Ktedonobacterales bacterium]